MNRKSKHTEISEICISPTEIVTNIADLLNKHFTEIGQKLASEIPEPPGGINFESCLIWAIPISVLGRLNRPQY